MKAIVYGGSGGLARSLVDALLASSWSADVVARRDLGSPTDGVQHHQVAQRYSEYAPADGFDAAFFPQALFVRKPLPQMSDAEIDDSLAIGLADIIRATRNLLAADTDPDRRVDYAFVGSTSAYAGFAQTSVYCAVKHGLLGFVRAMNDEYSGTAKRFWLFSMGTMDTEMGRMLTEQDPTSFLSPDTVARRIVGAISGQDNLFEPEVVIRRRSIRFKQA